MLQRWGDSTAPSRVPSVSRNRSPTSVPTHRTLTVTSRMLRSNLQKPAPIPQKNALRTRIDGFSEGKAVRRSTQRTNSLLFCDVLDWMSARRTATASMQPTEALKPNCSQPACHMRRALWSMICPNQAAREHNRHMPRRLLGRFRGFPGLRMPLISATPSTAG